MAKRANFSGDDGEQSLDNLAQVAGDHTEHGPPFDPGKIAVCTAAHERNAIVSARSGNLLCRITDRDQRKLQ